MHLIISLVIFIAGQLKKILVEFDIFP